MCDSGKDVIITLGISRTLISKWPSYTKIIIKSNNMYLTHHDDLLNEYIISNFLDKDM